MKTETDVKFQVSVGNMDEYCISSIKDNVLILLGTLSATPNTYAVLQRFAMVRTSDSGPGGSLDLTYFLQSTIS